VFSTSLQERGLSAGDGKSVFLHKHHLPSGVEEVEGEDKVVPTDEGLRG